MWKQLVSLFLMYSLIGIGYGQGNVPAGWYQHENYIYRVEDVATVRDEAEAVCNGYGATLAMLETQEKNVFAANLISQVTHGRGHYYIGLNDIRQEGIYRWPDGSRLYGFGEFQSGQPGRSGRYLCVAIIADDSRDDHARWDDLRCNNLFGYICSKQVDEVLPEVTQAPTLESVGPHNLLIGWAKWNESRDVGDGPVNGYSVYMKTGNQSWVSVGYMSERATSSYRLEYNATNLLSDTEYVVSVSPIQRYTGLEGPKGPQLTARTGVSDTACPGAPPGGNGGTSNNEGNAGNATVAWALFGITVACVVAVAVVIAFIWYRRKRRPHTQTRSPEISAPYPPPDISIPEPRQDVPQTPTTSYPAQRDEPGPSYRQPADGTDRHRYRSEKSALEPPTSYPHRGEPSCSYRQAQGYDNQRFRSEKADLEPPAYEAHDYDPRWQNRRNWDTSM